MLDRDGAEGVQSIRFDPEVCVGKTSAQLRRFDKELERPGDVPTRRGDQAEPTQADALPAGVTDLAADRKGVLEAGFRGGHVP